MRRSTQIAVFAAAFLIGCSDAVSGPRSGQKPDDGVPLAPLRLSASRPAFHVADLQRVTFENGERLLVPGNADVGVFSTYPSTIDVSGVAGTVATVIVHVRGIVHTFPDDIDLLLVGPEGQKVMIMSDVGASFDLNGVTLTIDDAASEPLPDRSMQLVTAAYQPNNIGLADVMPAPAPPGPYPSNLSTFAGTNPNGTWRLYGYDDQAGDVGEITNGWALEIVFRPNEAPVPSAGGPYAMIEGASVAVASSATDEDGDSFTLAWDLNNDGTFETPGSAGSVTYADNGAKTVVARATDEHGSFADASATVNVANAAPAIAPIGPKGAAGGVAVSVPVSFTDAGTNDAPWTIEIEWGDESSSSADATTQATPTTLSHVYAANGSYSARARVKDKDGDWSEWTAFAVTVGDASDPELDVTLTGTSASGFDDWNGWYSSPVTVDWTFGDPESGIATQSADCSDITDETLEQTEKTLTCTVTNGMGLSTTKSVTYRIDRTAPALGAAVIVGAVSPFAPGWYSGPVSVTWTASDVSPVHWDGAAADATSCARSVSTSTSGTTVACIARSAGGSATGSLAVKIDNTAPTIMSTLPAPSASGWYRTPVTVGWTVSEDVSSETLTSTGCGSATIAVEGIAAVSTCSATSAGGASSSSVTVKLDRTAPRVTLSGARTFSLSETVNITCTVSDNLSGIASSNCPTVSAPAYTLASGVRTLTATATDKAGNTATSTVSYTIGVTANGLCDLVEKFVSSSKVEKALCKQLTEAEKHGKKGQKSKAHDELIDFARDVVGQLGREIDVIEALILLGHARTLEQLLT